MKEIIFSGNSVDGYVLKGFYGYVVRSSTVQCGVYVPRQLMTIFKPKQRDGVLATRARVERRDDPTQCFTANVSRAGNEQHIVNVTIQNNIADPRFPPGTTCFVRIATAQDEP